MARIDERWIRGFSKTKMKFNLIQGLNLDHRIHLLRRLPRIQACQATNAICASYIEKSAWLTLSKLEQRTLMLE